MRKRGQEIKIKAQVGGRKCKKQSDRQTQRPRGSATPVRRAANVRAPHNLTFSVSTLSEISHICWQKEKVRKVRRSKTTCCCCHFPYESCLSGSTYFTVHLCEHSCELVQDKPKRSSYWGDAEQLRNPCLSWFFQSELTGQGWYCMELWHFSLYQLKCKWWSVKSKCLWAWS